MCSSELCCAQCCIGNSLLCVTVVTVVCSSEIYCARCCTGERLLCVLTVITQKLLHLQLHNSTAHLVYKLYSLQLNCTYSNYTEAAATCSAAQQYRNCEVDVFLCGCSRLFDILRTYRE